MNHNMDQSHSPLVTASFDRRGLFRIGGLTIAGAAIVAACGESEAGELGRVGVGATAPELQDPIVNDGVLLRTSASIEQSIVDAYQHILDSGVLGESSSTFPDLGDQTELVTLMQSHHADAVGVFNGLAEEAGETAWECGNTRLDSAYINPVFDRVEKGAAATDIAKAIDPSDDPLRDMINLVHTLESLSAASCQALVAQLTMPEPRKTSMEVGVRSARHAALVALRINPGGYVSASDAAAAQVSAPAATDTTVAATEDTQDIAAPTTQAPAEEGPAPTEIPLPVAVPSTFGLLSPTTYIGGRGDENGVRLKLNFETPSLNSFAYPFDTCDA